MKRYFLKRYPVKSSQLALVGLVIRIIFRR